MLEGFGDGRKDKISAQSFGVPSTAYLSTGGIRIRDRHDGIHKSSSAHILTILGTGIEHEDKTRTVVVEQTFARIMRLHAPGLYGLCLQLTWQRSPEGRVLWLSAKILMYDGEGNREVMHVGS